MNLRNLREMKNFAARRLEQSPSQQRIVLIYAGLTLGMTALVTVLNYLLGLQIDNYGGLSNLSKRTMLSTIQSILPMAQSLAAMGLNLGYLAAMLRIARGMYTSPQTLRLGFDRFWVLLRCSVFRGLILAGAMLLSMYLGILIYVLTPFSGPAMEIIMPLVSQTSVLDTGIVLDDAIYSQLVAAMVPCFAICGILMLVLAGPVYYSYRMADYVVIEQPAMGALMALRESKRMMKGNRLQLLKLDISLWWYYLAAAAATVIGYGDMLLPMLGVDLPVSETVGFFGFYGLYLLANFGILCFLRNRAEVCYALAYDAVKPEEKQNGGVVLGNIFQM